MADKSPTNNNSKSGYKKTKLGWIPEEWEFLKLENVIDLESGQHLSPTEYNGAGNGVPYFTGPTDFCSDTESVSKWTQEGKKFAEAGDVLITVKGSGVGTLYISSLSKIAIGRQLMAIRPKKVIQGFIFNFLLQRKKWLEVLASGNMIPGLSRKDILNFKIPLPPLPEQKKIAAILSTWNRAIETLEQLIAKKEELKKGLMQQLLTSKKRFPGFEGEWKEVKLDKLGEFSKGKGVSKSEVTDTGIPAVRYGELYTDHHVVIKEFTSHINRSSADQSKKIQKGDILFAGSGETAEEIGKCAVFTDEFEAYAGGDIVILRPKNVNPVYLSYYLNSAAAIKQKSNLGQGHSVVHIYSRDLKQINVLLPDIEQQNRIVEIFTVLESEIEALKNQRMLTEIQKKGLMQQLLTGKTRVNYG